MVVIKKLKKFKYNVLTAVTLFITRIKIRYLIPLGLIDNQILLERLIPEWEQRIIDVMACKDNLKITRCEKAGQIIKGTQIMHNGINITLGGYYGAGIAQMLYKNKGVHEPQEEYAFSLVLEEIRDNATMLELGCYWSFYSIWFLKKVKKGKVYLVEPDRVHLQYGINNFRLNKVKGDFTNALIGSESFEDDYGNRTISVPDFMKSKKIDFIDILHSDIQGAEYEMLMSLKEIIKNNNIGYFFISTHSNDIHYKCLQLLISMDYIILCHADENETCSYDGLIVAKSPMYKGINCISISKKEVLV